MRLDTLINNILISSQLDVDAYKPAKEDISFTALVQDTLNEFHTRYPERKMDTELDEDVELEGDPLLLKLLVSNLLENANKYSDRNLPIGVELKKGKTIVLKVKDRGAGIPEEEKKKIFRKFYRVGNERTRTTKGTGLGLYICKKIANSHGGAIQVENGSQGGSNFIVTFS
jgi:signal transduction histidine kinase